MALEKIAIGGVTAILKKLSSYAEKEIIRIWEVENVFKKLKKTSDMLLAALGDAEMRQNNDELVRLWLKSLKDVAYEADDVLGEFSYEATRREIESSMMEKVRGFFSNNQIIFRSDMARKIEKIYKELDNIKKDMEMFNFKQGDVNDHSGKNEVGRKTFPGIGDLQTFGRENEKSELIDMLIGSSSNEETLSVIPIVGIGGLGKTTLAKIVYNHDSVVAHFEKRMWVCVSDNFEIIKLIEEMVQSLTGVNPQLSNPEAIQRKLDDNLRGKKFLLVLDDVWNRDQQKWEGLRILLEIGNKGSKIIVTTRDDRVASIMRTLPPPLRLEELSQDDSWSLFKRRAFAIGGAEANPIKEKIGMELVKKCKGVPLAIQSLGALMHSKMSDHEWSSVQYSEIWKLETREGISPALKLSYHDLPPPLKHCFTYCSIFPKDYIMEKKTLIQLWMAEGLLQSSSSDDRLMEDVGDEYFKSLVWISFFQDVERDDFGEEVECKMHDIVHDLAQSIIGNECRIVEDFDNKGKPKVEETRYLSVVGAREKTTLEEFNNMEKVRACLYLNGYDYLSDSIHISAKMFSNFKSLCVLDLKHAGIKCLPSSIEKLIHLRYLDLSRNGFATFPKSITKLYNLQTLKMEGSFSVSILLPIGITKMINLRHLEFGHGEVRFPKGIGQLTNLQTLTFFSANKYTEAAAAGIEELRDLRQLGGSLKLNDLNWLENASAANLSGKPRLRNLHLAFNHRLNGIDCDNELLESLKPHQNLISLSIVGFTGTKAPTWMNGCSYLSRLQNLMLEECHNIKSLNLTSLCSLRWLKINSCQDLTSLGLLKGLTALEDITIYSCNNLMSLKVPEEDGMPDLIRLKTLKIYGCNSLAALPESFGNLLKLQKLAISICESLAVLPESFENLLELQELTIYDCGSLAALPESFGNLLKLQELSIDKCGSLAALPESFGNLLELQELSIHECGSLAALPESFGNLLKLQNLTIQQCGSLAELPESFGNLLKLQELGIYECGSLTALPESFGNLLKLQELGIDECGSLAALPKSFRNLLELQELSIGKCGSLAALPESFGNLLELQKFTIERCGSLAALPESFGNLLKLQELSIDECGSLATLPESFGNLLKLQNLTIQRCGSHAALLESFGNLLKLQKLTISICESLAVLPESFGNLLKLQKLTISICESLAVLPESFGNLLELQELTIYDCRSLAALPESFGNLLKLQKLSIGKCGSLAALPESFGNLLELQELSIYECGSLAALPESFGNLLKLQELSIYECGSLATLPESFGNLLEFQKLAIQRCGSLAALPESFGNLLKLQELSIDECPSLGALPKSLGLSLECLDVGGCNALTTLSENLGDLSSLESLHISNCPSLACLAERICGLTSLVDLSISYCKKMNSFPDGLQDLRSLRRLKICGFEDLEALPDGLRYLTSLQVLTISDCPGLTSLPDWLGELTSSEKLSLYYLENLRALPKGLGKLSSLQQLCLLGCKNLKYLPKEIQNLTSLQCLRVIDCPQLKERYGQHKSQGWPPIISHIPQIRME